MGWLKARRSARPCDTGLPASQRKRAPDEYGPRARPRRQKNRAAQARPLHAGTRRKEQGPSCPRVASPHSPAPRARGQQKWVPALRPATGIETGLPARNMKLVRYGPAGREKPGIADQDGTIRDPNGRYPNSGDVCGEQATAHLTRSGIHGRPGADADARSARRRGRAGRHAPAPRHSSPGGVSDECSGERGGGVAASS